MRSTVQRFEPLKQVFFDKICDNDNIFGINGNMNGQLTVMEEDQAMTSHDPYCPHATNADELLGVIRSFFFRFSTLTFPFLACALERVLRSKRRENVP